MQPRQENIFFAFQLLLVNCALASQRFNGPRLLPRIPLRGGGTVDRLVAAPAATLPLTRAPGHPSLSMGMIAGENVAESPSHCIVLWGRTVDPGPGLA